MRSRPMSLPRLAVLLCASGCGSAAPVDMMMRGPALPVCTKSLPPTAMPSFTGDVAACTDVTMALLHHDATSLVPDGYIALGPAVLFDGASGPFPHGIDLVVPADLAKAQAGAAASRIVVVGKRAGDVVSTVYPASNIVYESDWQRLHFHVPQLATYQAAIAKTAGTHMKRHYTYRAVAGVSMGGMGASLNGFRHPERYDAISVMGADPGPDLTYSLGLLREISGGFCTADSGKLGQLCPSTRKLLVDQFEEPMDFEHLNYQMGAGVGLTLSRHTYMHALRDLVRALGNPSYASDAKNPAPQSLYLPPGVPTSVLAKSPSEICAAPVVLKRFFDARYNPKGTDDVITFCDGGDSEAKGIGTFDSSVAQQNPIQILLAVDLNKNGKRDSGEPVLVQGSEIFKDVGFDGLSDENEPGYDAVTNPDPNHDDYHWAWNPTGTEGNWRFDQAGGKAEPFDDFGVDGVKGAGCTVGTGPTCYDLGEGNGTFDVTPGQARWSAHDPHELIPGISDDRLKQIDTWYDAGIRDFLNAEVATNVLTGVLQARGQHVRVWEGFPALVGLAPAQESKVNVGAIDIAPLGRHVYVRYGDPDLAAVDVAETGNGRHVGSVNEAINRIELIFYFMSRVFPHGDIDTSANPGATFNESFVAKNGRMVPYTVVVPPGYSDPGNVAKRYPVIYLMHGLGQKPEDLAQLALVSHMAMLADNIDDAHRMQKMIMVMVDGVCRPGGDVSNGTLPPDGDQCEGGNFFADHPDGSEQGEAQLLELQDVIDAKYRTGKPEDIDVVE